MGEICPSRIIGTLVLSCKPWRRTRSARERSRSGSCRFPIRLYTAASSANVAFNMLHAKCGSRIKQQTFCPVCNEVVDRASLVRGYEFSKDQYVRVADDELKGLEGEASKMIDIAEFVPLASVDPIYFEKTYFLGPDKGGDKAYRLLADAMDKQGRVALAKFVMRGKESLVLIRPAQGGLMLHTMYFADEVRDFGEIDRGQSAQDQTGRARPGQAAHRRPVQRRVPSGAVRGRVPRIGSSTWSTRRSRAKRSRSPPPRRPAPR